jgi:AcrR family transcriptional regulator
MVERRDGRRPGRPRSEAARRAILDAALAELREQGYAALTVEGIAARAGTGRQTVYRWWRTKADVVLDAMLDLAATLIDTPDTGQLGGDLVAFLSSTYAQAEQRPILAGLMAHAVLDPTFAATFRDRFLFARRAELRTVLSRASARGELDPAVDPELLLDVAFGVLWYRLLIDHAPLTERAGREVAELLVRAAGRGS